MTSAFPKSLNSSPNSGLPRQRTCHTARVGCFLPSSSIDSSLSRNVANPFGAIFGSLITNPLAVTLVAGRQAAPRSAALGIAGLKTVQQEEASPNDYIGCDQAWPTQEGDGAEHDDYRSCHQRRRTRGKNSASIIPIPAIAANPANG